MPRTPSAMPICPPEKKGCVEEALEIVEETAFDDDRTTATLANSNDCKCLPGCTSVEYPYEVTQSKMHRAQYLDLPPGLLGEPCLDIWAIYLILMTSAVGWRRGSNNPKKY